LHKKVLSGYGIDISRPVRSDELLKRREIVEIRPTIAVVPEFYNLPLVDDVKLSKVNLG
jgi:hypothetical protein